MNNNIYYKKASLDTYNSFLLNSYINLGQKPYSPYLFKDPIAFVTCNIKLESDNFTSLKDSNFAVFYSNLPDFSGLSCSPADSVSKIKMDPNQISLVASASGPSMLVIKQNNAKGWKAFINNEETRIYTANETMICLKLKKGLNQVQLRYKPDFINYCLAISWLSLLLGFGLVVYKSYRP
jgi:uncharacterized membrane protein YfhO